MVIDAPNFAAIVSSVPVIELHRTLARIVPLGRPTQRIFLVRVEQLAGLLWQTSGN